MKIQHILLSFLIAILCFAAGFWLGPQYSVTPNPYLEAMRDHHPALYKSKHADENVVLAGDAGKVRTALVQADLLQRVTALGGVLSQLGPDSLDAVREAFDTVFLDLGETELVLFADWWARFDPHAAIEWSETEWRAEHLLIVMQILRTWGQIDPQAALVRAEQGRGPKHASKRRYQLAAISGWEAKDPLAVLVYLESMPVGIQRQRMMRGFARRRVLRYGIEDAFKFVESLPDGDQLFKLNMMRRVVSAAVHIDAPLTAQLVTSLQAGPYFNNLPQRVVIPWVRKDPQAAVQWLESLTDSESRSDGVREAYRSWLAYDSADAIDWVTGTKHEAWRDPALALYAKYVQLGDKEKGVALAEQIEDDELRQATLTLIVRVWAEHDREAAENYAERSGWTQNQRDRALAVGWRKRAYATNKLAEEAGTAPAQIKEKMERNLIEADFDDPAARAAGSNEKPESGKNSRSH